MRRLLWLILIAAEFGGSPLSAQQRRGTHYTYVIVHGAWGGGWDWRAVDSMLTRLGHRVVRTTLTGLGERVHLASPDIGLSTHIDDVVNKILWDDLRDVVLIGHSYGGMVITGVADRIPERIRRLVYLDAFLPDSGETALGLADSTGAAFLRANVREGFEPTITPDPFQRFADRASAREWPVYRLQANHVPERSARSALVALLERVP